MSAKEFLNLLFELLYAEFQGQGEAEELRDARGPLPTAFVGLQGEHIVVIQPGGAHLAISVQEAGLS